MTDNRNNEPGNRMRKILYDSENDTIGNSTHSF